MGVYVDGCDVDFFVGFVDLLLGFCLGVFGDVL